MSILAVLEIDNNGLNRSSREVVALAQQIGQESGMPVRVVCIGKNTAAAGNYFAGMHIDRVFTISHELLETYTPDAYAAVLEAFIRRMEPFLVLFPHTYRVRDYAPKLAVRFGTIVASDAIGHRWENGELIILRRFFSGKLNADIRFSGKAPHFVSVQAGAYSKTDIKEGNSAPIEVCVPDIFPDTIRSKPSEPFREAKQTIDLASATIIVAVGRGIKEKENISLVEKLAYALGGELAASRPVCDNGWLLPDRQVGSSGQTVSPKLYIAVGISGAIQHLVGMKGSETVIAINKDPDAPIFDIADYGIVGDLFEIIPALTEEIEKAKK